MHHIYLIENTESETYYVGQARKVLTRKSQHFSDLRKNRHGNSHLQRAWDKYGEDAFKFSIIEQIDTPDKANEMETFYIAYLRFNGIELYNQNAGGDSRALTEATRNLLSQGRTEYYQNLRGGPRPPKTCEVCGNAYMPPVKKYNRSKTCSHACHREAITRGRRVAHPPKTCVVCGEEFLPSNKHYNRAITCSNPCRYAYIGEKTAPCARERAASMSPEQRRELTKKALAGRLLALVEKPEQLEDLRERMRSRNAALTPEERRERAKKAAITLQTTEPGLQEERSQRMKNMNAALTTEERRERGRKAWATQQKNAKQVD